MPGKRGIMRKDGNGLLPNGVRHMGGLQGAGKEVVKAVFARCTAPLLPSTRPAAVGALRQGLSVQLGRSVARQLEAPMMVFVFPRGSVSVWRCAVMSCAPGSASRGASCVGHNSRLSSSVEPVHN